MSRPATLRKRDGSTFSLSYDALGRIYQRVVKDNTATLERTYVFKFDIMGRSNYAAVTKSSVTTTITMTYDALGRKIAETGAHGYGTTYAYDDATGEVEITYNDPGADTYRITRLVDQQGLITSVKETRNSANRDLAYFTYDEMGRMTKHSTGADRDMIYTYETDGDLDKVVNELSSTLSTVNYDYSYNAAGQISSKSISTALYQWSPAANDTINSFANSMNQITSYDGGAVTYDNNGNLKTRGNRTLTWSVENYLEKVVASSVTLGEYKYDALGRRIEKTASSTTTKYIMDGGNVIAEYTGTTLLRRYVYGPGIDRPIAVITPSGANITREYYHFDGQGSVIATVDDNDVVTASYAYDSYGKVDDLTGNVYRYTGRRLDAETGYYYYRARYYDPDMGRFLSADPIGYGDGLNMYAYTGNDPVNFIDPSGLDEGCPGCSSSGGGYGRFSFATSNTGPSKSRLANAYKQGSAWSQNGVFVSKQFPDGTPASSMTDRMNSDGSIQTSNPGFYGAGTYNGGVFRDHNTGNQAAPQGYVEVHELDGTFISASGRRGKPSHIFGVEGVSDALKAEFLSAGDDLMKIGNSYTAGAESRSEYYSIIFSHSASSNIYGHTRVRKVLGGRYGGEIDLSSSADTTVVGYIHTHPFENSPGVLSPSGDDYDAAFEIIGGIIYTPTGRVVIFSGGNNDTSGTGSFPVTIR